MNHDYQTWQDYGLWYSAFMHKVLWFFDHVVIYSLMKNKNIYIFNSKCPLGTKLDRVVAYDMRPILNKSFSEAVFFL